MIKKPLLQKTFLLITVIFPLFSPTFGSSKSFFHHRHHPFPMLNGYFENSSSSYVTDLQNEQIPSASVNTGSLTKEMELNDVIDRYKKDEKKLHEKIQRLHEKMQRLQKEVKSEKKNSKNSTAMYQALLKTVNSQLYGNLEGYKKLSVEEVKDIWFENAKSANFYKLFEIRRLPWLGKAAAGFIDDRNRSALHYVIEKGNFMLLKELVENLNFSKDCYNCLSEKLKGYIDDNNNSFQLNKELLTGVDSEGYTPMDIAIEKKAYRSFEYLYKKCKQYKVESTTMLHNYSFTDLIKMLDDAKTEVESMNQNSTSNCQLHSNLTKTLLTFNFFFMNTLYFSNYLSLSRRLALISSFFLSSYSSIYGAAPLQPGEMNYLEISQEVASDYMYKILFVGDSNVGKTALFNRIKKKEFKQTCSTAFPEQVKYFIQIDDATIQLNIWDTSGHEQFSILTRSACHGTNCLVICYDISNKESLVSCRERWLNEIEENLNNTKCLIICGTKCDKKGFEVVTNSDKKSIKAFFESKKIFKDVYTLETSAKEDINIQQLVRMMGYSLLKFEPKQYGKKKFKLGDSIILNEGSQAEIIETQQERFKVRIKNSNEIRMIKNHFDDIEINPAKQIAVDIPLPSHAEKINLSQNNNNNNNNNWSYC